MMLMVVMMYMVVMRIVHGADADDDAGPVML